MRALWSGKPNGSHSVSLKVKRIRRLSEKSRFRFLVPFPQRTPWRGGKERGVENLTNDTPLKKGSWTPPRTVRFPPPQVSVLCFSCTKIHDRADQKLFWRGPKVFGRARSLVRFPPPIRFAPPHVTAQFPLGFPRKCDKEGGI